MDGFPYVSNVPWRRQDHAMAFRIRFRPMDRWRDRGGGGGCPSWWRYKVGCVVRTNLLHPSLTAIYRTQQLHTISCYLSKGLPHLAIIACLLHALFVSPANAPSLRFVITTFEIDSKSRCVPRKAGSICIQESRVCPPLLGSRSLQPTCSNEEIILRLVEDDIDLVKIESCCLSMYNPRGLVIFCGSYDMRLF